MEENDAKLLKAIDEAIAESIRLGIIVKGPNGGYKITEVGKEMLALCPGNKWTLEGQKLLDALKKAGN